MAERHDAKVALTVARGLVAKVQELIKNQWNKINPDLVKQEN